MYYYYFFPSQVLQKQPLVERHLGSSSIPTRIIFSSDEQPQQEQETEKSPTDNEPFQDLPEPSDSDVRIYTHTFFCKPF